MKAKFYIDSNGNYIGAFTGSIPVGGIEVEAPPPHGLMIFADGIWDYPLPIKSSNEREWRDSELQRADIEIFKTEDIAGVFDAELWRSYRLLLRAWPDSPDFPDQSARPTAPDAV